MKATFLPAANPADYVKSMDPIFLSALNPGNTQQAASFGPPMLPTDERLRGTPAFYPHLLLSYHYWAKEQFTFPKEGYIFGDSGGYSIMTLGAVVDPQHVVRWQAANCTVGAHLDVPPRSKGTGGQRKGIWLTALTKTIENTICALPVYEAVRKKGSAFKWWGVCHGGTKPQLEEWYRGVSKVYLYDDEGEGWCFKPFPIHPVNTATGLRFIKEKGIKRAHFLMATGMSSVAVLLALGERAGLDVLTYDSSSAGMAGVNRRVMVPTDDYRWDVIEEKTRASGGEDARVRNFLLEKCKCPACLLLQEEVAKGDKDLLRSTHLHWKHRMIFHNTLIMLQTFTEMAAEARKDPEGLLKDVLGPKMMYQVLRAFDGREPDAGVEEGTPNSLLNYL